MKIGPKYKIARRLGAPIFEKTQTQKYALRLAKKGRKNTRGPRSRTLYALQVAEKQKARFTYGITEGQLAKYVKESMAQGKEKPVQALYATLERRLDNIAYIVGFASTRRLGRQMSSHGHLTVNGRKVTIPSYQVGDGDVVAFREGSKTSDLFKKAEERVAERDMPTWITFDKKKMEGKIKGSPSVAEAKDLLFDLEAIVEFYSR